MLKRSLKSTSIGGGRTLPLWHATTGGGACGFGGGGVGAFARRPPRGDGVLAGDPTGEPVGDAVGEPDSGPAASSPLTSSFAAPAGASSRFSSLTVEGAVDASNTVGDDDTTAVPPARSRFVGLAAFARMMSPLPWNTTQTSQRPRFAVSIF